MPTRVRGLVSKQQGIHPTKNKGMIQCPMCDSTAVDKAIMAPNVKTSKIDVEPGEDFMVMGESADQILRKLNKKIKKDFQDVGKNFAREARITIRPLDTERIMQQHGGPMNVHIIDFEHIKFRRKRDAVIFGLRYF